MTAAPETEVPTPAALPAPSPASRPKPTPTPWLLALGLLVLAVLAAWVLDYLQAQRVVAPQLARLQTELAELTTALKTHEESMGGNLKATQGRLSTAEAALTAATQQLTEASAAAAARGQELTQLAERVGLLSDALKQLSAERPSAELDWSVAEVEYLIFAANQRLALSGDVIAAEAILKAADERIANLNEPALFDLREAIAADRTELLAIQLPDISGLAIYLGSLAAQADTLPFKASPIHEHRPEAATEAGASPASQASPGWSQHWGDVWGELKQLVVVRKIDQVDLASLDPAAQTLIRESLRLELLAARLAVLKADTANLHGAIERSSALLKQHFDPNAPGVTSTLKGLAELVGRELKPALPKVLRAQAAVQALQASRSQAAQPVAAP